MHINAALARDYISTLPARQGHLRSTLCHHPSAHALSWTCGPSKHNQAQLCWQFSPPHVPCTQHMHMKQCNITAGAAVSWKPHELVIEIRSNLNANFSGCAMIQHLRFGVKVWAPDQAGAGLHHHLVHGRSIRLPVVGIA